MAGATFSAARWMPQGALGGCASGAGGHGNCLRSNVVVQVTGASATRAAKLTLLTRPRRSFQTWLFHAVATLLLSGASGVYVPDLTSTHRSWPCDRGT